MDNQTKQNMAALEARVVRLERIIEDMSCTMMAHAHAQPVLTCNQCGYHDPINNGIICSKVDCCMGLNPDDDRPL